MGETASLRQTWGGGCRCHIQIKEVPLNRKDLISSPSQDQLPGLNIYLSVFQAGDTANYGSNSHGYREELSELGSQSSDQDRAETKNAPNILRGNSGVVKGHASSAGMPPRSGIWRSGNFLSVTFLTHVLRIPLFEKWNLKSSFFYSNIIWQVILKKSGLYREWFSKTTVPEKRQTWPSGQPTWHKHFGHHWFLSAVCKVSCGKTHLSCSTKSRLTSELLQHQFEFILCPSFSIMQSTCSLSLPHSSSCLSVSFVSIKNSILLDLIEWLSLYRISTTDSAPTITPIAQKKTLKSQRYAKMPQKREGSLLALPMNRRRQGGQDWVPWWYPVM